jgi:Kef-type K+ transport system membrane component KefB
MFLRSLLFFAGAALTATSISITSKVLSEMGQLKIKRRPNHRRFTAIIS